LVKQRPLGPRAPVPALALVLWLASACGGSAPPPTRPDPFGPRVAECIDAPRVLNDAAQGRMVRVPAGLAVQGSLARERAQARIDYGQGAGPSLFENETPVRRAYLAAFALDLTPVTNELYAEFAAACGVLPPDAETVSQARWDGLRQRFGLRREYAQIQRFLWSPEGPMPERARHPAVLVSHDDAGFYCAWRGGRLPSEQEWERAARGPTGNLYPWGNRYDPFRVNTAQRGTRDTIEVGTLPQGNAPEGFSDMGGHVFEWTATPWPGKQGEIVVKGNGWDGRGGFGRGAARAAWPAELIDVTLGFRCAAD
jgi:formylglycine-generating enzyme required for sulfatase activity